ncbi:hypothetical protein B0H14DRAFT_3451875 [Mycena olivaceomarginata]|nr:hypothetical protein B0H14DRAFT_3451875 [Mycena olivaceomarginata]
MRELNVGSLSHLDIRVRVLGGSALHPGVHPDWEQHARNPDGSLKDAEDMDWDDPDAAEDEQDVPGPSDPIDSSTPGVTGKRKRNTKVMEAAILAETLTDKDGNTKRTRKKRHPQNRPVDPDPHRKKKGKEKATASSQSSSDKDDSDFETDTGSSSSDSEVEAQVTNVEIVDSLPSKTVPSRSAGQSRKQPEKKTTHRDTTCRTARSIGFSGCIVV